MNPHELIKHSFDSLTPGEGFSERILQAVQEKAQPKKHSRLPRIALIAAILVIALAVTGAATGVLRDWLSGVVEVNDETALSGVGETLLEQDVNGMHVRYGKFLCVGRFLYMEVEITKQDGTPVTQEDLYDVSFDNGHAYGLTLDYDTSYQHGIYTAEGEGYVGHSFRLDDETKPGYGRFTLAWSLARHDYAGQTLHVQIWEPYEWADNPDGTQTARNSETRKLLTEMTILRQTPADEQIFHFENGDEVRICAFGAEIQGTAFLDALDEAFQKIREQDTAGLWESCGVLLANGTRVRFNPNVNGGRWPELDSADHWTAAPFSATVDPAQVVAIYLGDTVWKLV